MAVVDDQRQEPVGHGPRVRPVQPAGCLQPVVAVGEQHRRQGGRVGGPGGVARPQALHAALRRGQFLIGRARDGARDALLERAQVGRGQQQRLDAAAALLEQARLEAHVRVGHLLVAQHVPGLHAVQGEGTDDAALFDAAEHVAAFQHVVAGAAERLGENAVEGEEQVGPWGRGPGRDQRGELLRRQSAPPPSPARTPRVAGCPVPCGARLPVPAGRRRPR